MQQVSAAIQDDNGNWWLATELGLVFYDTVNEEISSLITTLMPSLRSIKCVYSQTNFILLIIPEPYISTILLIETGIHW